MEPTAANWDERPLWREGAKLDGVDRNRKQRERVPLLLSPAFRSPCWQTLPRALTSGAEKWFSVLAWASECGRAGLKLRQQLLYWHTHRGACQLPKVALGRAFSHLRGG